MYIRNCFVFLQGCKLPEEMWLPYGMHLSFNVSLVSNITSFRKMKSCNDLSYDIFTTILQILDMCSLILYCNKCNIDITGKVLHGVNTENVRHGVSLTSENTGTNFTYLHHFYGKLFKNNL